VKRLFAWLAGVVGGAAAYRAYKRPPAPAPAAPDPAQALKEKLAEARAAGDERAEVEVNETPVDEAPDVDSRRRSVHDQARAAIDEMNRE
jgi:hypothetical protein